MVAGTYTLTLKTPVGAKKGELVLEESGTSLTGAIIVKGKRSPIENGAVDGERFSFCGVLETSMGKMAYEASGSVSGDVITGEAKTSKGSLKMSGKRR